MALMLHKSSLPAFEFAPNPEFDAEITAIKNRYESIMEKIKTKKVSAADVYYAGASITDEATQTEESEIVDVKNATKVLMGLTSDSENLKSKLEVFYESTMTEYQNLVESKANLIYDQCAELLRDIQRQNDATLERTRRAYKQQLADAIASLSSMYTKNMQLKLRTVELRQTDLSEKNAAETLRMRDRIRQLEDQVEAMSRELGDMERAKALEWNEGAEDMVSVAVSPINDAAREAAAKEAAALSAKLENQEATINDLKAKILDCEMIIKARDSQIDKLEKEMKEIGSEHANQAAEIERLQTEKARLENEMTAQSENFRNQKKMMEKNSKKEQASSMSSSSSDSQSVRRLLDMADSESPETKKSKLKEKLAQMELDLQATIDNAKEEVREQFKKETQNLVDQERAKYVALEVEKKRVEVELAKERRAMLEKSKDDRDIEAMRSAKARAEAEAERLRRDVDKVHRMWEKKFSILQSSLHALKDEMFVRRYLEKQAAQLHTSAVAFVFGKHAFNQQNLPKPPDTTVRSKSITGYGGDDSKPISGNTSSYTRNAETEQPLDGAGVAFRGPNHKAKRTVWDTRPPTQTSIHQSLASAATAGRHNDEPNDHQNITNHTSDI